MCHFSGAHEELRVSMCHISIFPVTVLASYWEDTCVIYFNLQ